MIRLPRALVRTLAFVQKEIYEILRQPRLLFTLILGPFLILLIFGIGYRNEPRALRTLFVVGKDSPLSKQVEEYATSLGPQLIFMGINDNVEQALLQLKQGKVDLVAITPEDAYQTIQNSEQAVFVLYHHEIDPVQVSYVKYFGQIYIDEVNHRILLAITQQSQTEASSFQKDLDASFQDATMMRKALEAGDLLTSQKHLNALSKDLTNVSLAVGTSLALLSSVQNTIGGGPPDEAKILLSALSEIQQNTNALNQTMAIPANNAEKIKRALEIENALGSLNSQLKQFTSIDANVLIKPFRSVTKNIAAVQPTDLDFFAPAVVVLLLQHIAVTFGALSIVRERSVGTLELFRVSPLSAGETLLGKYLSYFLFGGILTIVLTLLLVFGLRMPLLGSLFDYAIVIGLLLFTSLGIGFILSLLSRTDSQAVQYTMIVLLTSVFFSGFLMRLEMLSRPVRTLSWAIPTTYGIILLRDIALRGNPPDTTLLGGLALIGLGLCLVAWLLLRRLVSG